MTEFDKMIDDIMFTKRSWPEWVQQLFPMVFLYYKKSKPKIRKRNDGYLWKLKSKEPGQMRKYQHKPIKNNFKNERTSKQNCYSYASCILLSADEMGTCQRTLKHKGYSKLIAAFYATDQEVQSVKDCWRMHFTKYKTIKDFYQDRQLDDPQFKEICDRLIIQYPSVFNQLALFNDEPKRKK
jgi:hypothetical protein